MVEMARLAHEAKADGNKELEFQCHKEVAQYVEPKRKAVEVTADVTHHQPERAEMEADLLRLGVDPQAIVDRVRH